MAKPKSKRNKRFGKKKKETFDEKKERYETPKIDYDWLVNLVRLMGLPAPILDIMASKKNTKCLYFLDEKYDVTQNDFLIRGKKRGRIPSSIYLNAPHKLYHKMVPQCENQWQKYGFTIIALIPSRNERTSYWRKIIEPNRFEVIKGGHIFYFPLNKQFIFEVDGKPLKVGKEKKVMHDPNGYKLVIWIGKKHLKKFKKNLARFYRVHYLNPLKEN